MASNFRQWASVDLLDLKQDRVRMWARWSIHPWIGACHCSDAQACQSNRIGLQVELPDLRDYDSAQNAGGNSDVILARDRARDQWAK